MTLTGSTALGLRLPSHLSGWMAVSRERRREQTGRTTTRVFTLSPGLALPCSRHPRGKGERRHGDILPYNWNTFRKQREREERRETFHFLRKTYEKWIRVRSKERGEGREGTSNCGRVSGSLSELDHENGRVGTGMGTLSNIPELLQYWISSE